MDINDNTGEKNELATLIGNFNPGWDSKGSNDEAFFQAVSVAGMILENKFERYLGNERADRRVEEVLAEHTEALASGETPAENTNILVLPEFIPCQKRLSETNIAFVIFPSNRGGYCIQPQKKEYSMNYKCSFPSSWLGLEGEELASVTGLESAIFCHKGGFLMTCGTLEDSILACRSSLAAFHEEAVIVSLGGNDTTDMLLQNLPELPSARIVHLPVPQLPELTLNGIYGELSMEKAEWKSHIKDQLKEILRYSRQCHVFSVPDRPCTAKKTYSCPYSNRKRRPEASGANPIWFIKSVKRSRYIYTAYLYRKKAYLCAKKNLKWKDRD